MINLGSATMEPVNLGRSGKLAFDARGEGKRYRAMAFAENLGQMPAIVEFNAAADWQRVEIPLTGFPGFDPKGPWISSSAAQANSDRSGSRSTM